MKSDAQIKQDVLDELVFQPNIDETQIGVSVEDGIVALSGVVDRYAKIAATEKAAKKVAGVKAVTETIAVKTDDGDKKTDEEIAKAVVDALKWNSAIPEEELTIKVEKGWVYLSGEVQWGYEKKAANRVVGELLGVQKIVDGITVKPDENTDGVKEKIKNAFERSAEIDANKITVGVDGHTILLTGTVSSIKEKEVAERAAFMAPGVSHVKNGLKVQS